MDLVLDLWLDMKCTLFMDGYSGYNQVKMVKEDKKKIMFILKWVAYAYNVMPFWIM
jgi:hypothetical protein